jgi:hypothetical protein
VGSRHTLFTKVGLAWATLPWLVSATALSLAGCATATIEEAASQETNDTVQTSMTQAFERARGARVFFSHHSVGRNLIEGVQLWSAEQPGGGVQLLPLEQAVSKPGPVWLHASGGRNGEPQSKVDFFVQAIDRQAERQPRLAFMKFCYVDFNPDTDVDRLFAYYQGAIDGLKSRHPGVIFGHVTVPLTRHPTELKWRLYRMLGRSVWEDEANIKRQAFNGRLLQTFGKDPIFDLARAESTHADGSREAYERDGKTYYALDARYAADEGHLNELGRRELGAELVRFVARSL